MKLKKILLVIALVIIIGAVFFVVSRNKNTEISNNGKINVVVTNFASYDFVRAIIKDTDNVELTFLIGPGKNVHSYDPTAQDLITIQNADLFVYIGGTMEKWIDNVLSSMNNKDTQNIICISDFVEKYDESKIDGAQEDTDEEEEEDNSFDEHIWTSPANAIKMIETLKEEIENLDPSNKDIYEQNAENYIAQINNVDQEIQNIVDNKVRDRLVFADKMPMRYFINYYGLNVSAAFSGCSTETEPSAATISYLEEIVKNEKIPVVLYIELNDGRVAQTIVNDINDSNVEALQIQSLQNISKEDFDNGETWVSLMERNLEVLRKALQ